MRPITDIVIHCSATPRGRAVTMETIRQWHLDKKWADIGYHFVIELDGKRRTGRALENPGAHVEGHNATTIGICMVGGVSADGKRAEDTFTISQLAELVKLVRELKAKYPHARVLGHRDFSPDKNHDGKVTPNEWLKACPSFDVRAWATSHAIDHTPKAED